MATKGTVAKETISNALLAQFEEAFVQDKKVYITLDDGGEMVQVAVSMTCPKVPVESGVASISTPKKAIAFDWSDSVAARPQISAEDQAKIDQLTAMLNL